MYYPTKGRLSLKKGQLKETIRAWGHIPAPTGHQDRDAAAILARILEEGFGSEGAVLDSRVSELPLAFNGPSTALTLFAALAVQCEHPEWQERLLQALEAICEANPKCLRRILDPREVEVFLNAVPSGWVLRQRFEDLHRKIRTTTSHPSVH